MRHILALLLILSVFAFKASICKGQIIINELLASNNSTNLDDQNLEFCDWIELHNNSEASISIGDWYLSDNNNNPTKWKIPFYMSISPGAYKLFWCDGSDKANHTNFKLNAKGESLYLYNKDTVIVDSIKYPKQLPDISYGRITGNPSQLVYFAEVTPEKENLKYGTELISYTNQPVFSKKAGFHEKPFQLELSSSSEDDKIFYTLDGSSPILSSNLYTKPIEINKNTVIRARVYNESKLPGNTRTQTYLINEKFTLPVFSLAINPDYLWDKEVGIYVKGVNGKKNNGETASYTQLWEPANYFQKWERPINVEHFSKDGQAQFNIKAGTRIHGRSSRTFSQKTLAIFLREEYGTPSISHKFFGDHSPAITKSFLLRNGGNDWGMTMFLDGLVHSLVIDAMDIDAQRYQPSIVFLNGEYWGIHNIREKINENYIKHKYPGISKDFDILETDLLAKDLVVSTGNFDEYNKLMSFIEKNDLSIKANYYTICNWVDVNELLNYLVTQVYIGNYDWPQSNMKFWKERNNKAKWRWILYDTELSFRESSKYAHFNIFEHMLTENEKVPANANLLLRKMFESSEFKNEFIQRLAISLNTVFDTERVMHVLDSLKRNITPEVNRNFAKWGGIKQPIHPFYMTAKNTTEWDINIKYVKDFINNRPSVIRKNTLDFFNLNDSAIFKVRISDEKAGKIRLMGSTLNQGRFDGYVFTEIPIRIEAIPNEGYVFEKWKGGTEQKNCTITVKGNKKLTAIFRKLE